MNIKANSYNINVTKQEITEIIKSINNLYAYATKAENENLVRCIKPLLEAKHAIMEGI